MYRYCLLLLLSFGMVNGILAQAPAATPSMPHPEVLHILNDELVQVISFDKFTPPPASRIHAYPTLATHEAMSAFYPKELPPLQPQINQLTPLPKPDPNQSYDMTWVALTTYIRVADIVIYNWKRYEEKCMERLKPYLTQNLNPEIQKRSVAHGKAIADHFKAWIAKDNFQQRVGLARYTLKKLPHTWETTPPAYNDGLEANWRTIRPLWIRSVNDVTVEPHHPFSTDPNSLFYQDAYEVYSMSKMRTKTADEDSIAWFWDDNCKATNMQGHFMSMTFKQTPIGHWTYITQSVCRTKNADFITCVKVYALAFTAIFDAVILTWNEKYRSELIRPITYINRHIDKEWNPTLETPYFPEHPSGHGAISAAAATVLRWHFGDKVTFIDSSTISYGRAPRTYNSLSQAAYDAAISRMYGGIHYRKGCEVGNKLGTHVGELVMTKYTANLPDRKKQ
jgi:hypothetical protein